MQKEAIQAQARMNIEQNKYNQHKANYEKNFKKAEMAAQKIMMSAGDNEMQGLSSVLIPAAKPEPVHKQAPQSMMQVVSQAHEQSISNSVLQKMKDKMHAKLNQHAVVPPTPKPIVQPVQSLVTLPIKKPIEEPHDNAQNDDTSVTSLISQFQHQKKKEQELAEKEEKSKQEKEEDQEQTKFEK